MKEKKAAHGVSSGIEGAMKGPNPEDRFYLSNHHSQLYIVNVFSFWADDGDFRLLRTIYSVKVDSDL